MGERVPKPQQAPTQTKKPTVSPEERKKRDQSVLGAGPEVLLDAVPKGRTKAMDSAIAATLSDDVGLGPTLQAWTGGLNDATAKYSAHRDAVTKLYVEHKAKSPSGPVGHNLHAERYAALRAECDVSSELVVRSQGVAVLSGPTLAILELADRSYTELMAALVASGHAQQQKGALIVDGARVRSETAFHLQAEEDAHIKPSASTMHGLTMALTDAHGKLDVALFGAAAVSHDLRKQALDMSTSKIQQEIERRSWLINLCGSVDSLVGGLAQVSNLAGGLGPILGGGAALDGIIGSNNMGTREGARLGGGAGVSPTKVALAGGGLMTKLATLIAGGEIGELQRKVQANKDLAGMEAHKTHLGTMEKHLAELEQAIETLNHQMEHVESEQHVHRVGRTRGGGQMDTAARGRAELGPMQELHVPIADRLARIEIATAFNTRAHQAAERLLDRLHVPASMAELAHDRTRQSDLAKLRETLPPNIFRVMRRSLLRLCDELSTRHTTLEGLKVQ